MHDAEQAAGQAERHHLQDVDGDDLAAARAEALQDGDAADLLQDEDARDARHRDAAEDHDDQADQAQVVLGAIEIAADLILGRAERPRVDELVLEVARAASVTSGSTRSSGTLTSMTRRARLPKPSRPVDGEIGVVDEHARAEAELADAAPRLAARSTPRIVNVAWPIDDLIADRDAERRQQLGPDERRRGSASSACE